MRILLIEDDAEIASYILNRLAELGHVVEHVADGREGLILATTGSYDALVIDLMLPGLRWTWGSEDPSRCGRGNTCTSF